MNHYAFAGLVPGTHQPQQDPVFVETQFQYSDLQASPSIQFGPPQPVLPRSFCYRQKAHTADERFDPAEFNLLCRTSVCHTLDCHLLTGSQCSQARKPVCHTCHRGSTLLTAPARCSRRSRRERHRCALSLTRCLPPLLMPFLFYEYTPHHLHSVMRGVTSGFVCTS